MHESGLPPNSSGNQDGHRRYQQYVHTSYLEFLTATLFYGSGNSSEMGSNLPKFSVLPKKQWEDSTVGFPESKGQILSTIPRSSHEGTDFQ